MLGEAIPTFLTSFHAWFTPAVLFVLLNVVIGTIAVTSKASRREDGPIPLAGAIDSASAKLSRSPSAVLHRIRSFNLHLHLPTENPLDPPSPAMDPNEPDPEPMDLSAGEMDLSRSPSAGEIETKLAERLKKSAIEKPALELFEEAEITPRPDSIAGEEGEEVDARADDFINRFRQQLKLQRLDSVGRYNTMISGER